MNIQTRPPADSVRGTVVEFVDLCFGFDFTLIWIVVDGVLRALEGNRIPGEAARAESDKGDSPVFVVAVVVVVVVFVTEMVCPLVVWVYLPDPGRDAVVPAAVFPCFGSSASAPKHHWVRVSGRMAGLHG